MITTRPENYPPGIEWHEYNGKQIGIVTSWDDGHREDMLIAEILLKYKLPGIFFLPDICHLSESAIRHLVESGFILGGHTVTHPLDLKLLSPHDLEQEIKINKQFLQQFQKDINVFAYPRGRYNDAVMKTVSQYYDYARTTLVHHTCLPENNMRWHTTVQVFNRREYQRPFLDEALAWWEYVKDNGGVFHVWGHSYELSEAIFIDMQKLFKTIYEDLHSTADKLVGQRGSDIQSELTQGTR